MKKRVQKIPFSIFKKMDSMQEYFPTKALLIAEARLSFILRKERERLDFLGKLNYELCKSTLKEILQFTENYERAFSAYLSAALSQHTSSIACRAGCGNCCRHYPMSIEPFELITFYASLRERPDFFSLLEACLIRNQKFASLAHLNDSPKENFENRAMASEEKTECCDSKNSQKNLAKIPEEDEEDKRLHRYFESGLSCPFLLADGNCGVYEVRPATCRMYFSETPGEFCTARFLLTEKNKSFIVYLPDKLESAIAEISEFYEPLDLPEALYAGVVRMNALDGEIFE